MKNFKLFIATLFVAFATVFAACDNSNDPSGPGKKPDTDPTPKDSTKTVTWDDVTLPDGAITVAKALEIGNALEAGATTTEKYYVYGIVKKVSTTEATITSYGNQVFYMVDKTDDAKDFEAFQVYNVGNQKFTALNQIEVGDRVILYTQITNYNGTQIESPGKGAAYVYWTDNKNQGTTPDPTPDPAGLTGDGSKTNPYTVSDVIALNNTKTGNYYVKGIIVGQVKGGSTSANGNLEFASPFTATENNDNTNLMLAVSAGETELAKLVPIQLPAGYLRDALNLIAHPENIGKELVIKGSLEKYFGQAGVKSMTEATLAGEEIVLVNGDAPAATVATVAEFNAAAVNSTVPGVYFELTGTVSNISNTSYGNFDLTDATGTVYVYGLTANYLILSTATKANNDKSFANLGIADGDNITIRGVRADYNGKIEVLGAYLVKKN